MPSWKKLIVSGSDASLSSLTTTGKLQLNSSETGSTIFEVNGVNGRLFTITDEMSGSLFNISTTAGLPVIEALSDGKVTLGPFSAQTEIDTSGNLELGGNISGSATSTGSFGVLKLDKFNGGIGASTNTLYGVDAGSSIDASVTTETAIGYQALKDNANAGANTAVGAYALWQYNGSTGRNTAVGLKAGWNLTGGYRGTYIGWEAEAGGANNIGEIVIGYAVTGKGSNTAVIGGGNITDIYMSSDVGAKLHTGDVSGSAISTGSFGHLLVNGSAVGGSDSFSDGTATTISGSATSTGSFGHIQMSGRNFPPQLFTTGSSIYMGDGGTGLSDDGSGNDNVGIGTEVLTGIANGAHNVAIGNNALKARTVGSNNIAIGQKAGGSDADDFGSHNILMGENAGLNINNTGTSFNVMIGQSAGMAITNAYKNTFVGNSAGSTITTGTQNVAIGNNAGGADGATAQTNTRSIFVGDAAKASADGNTNEIVIGKTTTGKGSNTVTIGNDDTTDFYITEGTQATLHTGTVSGSSTSTGSFGAIQSAGNITPKVDDSVDLGASNLRFKNIFTTDLQLSNEGKEKGNEVDGTTGSWTIQEGEEELYLLNRKNGKKYKFMLQEIK